MNIVSDRIWNWLQNATPEERKAFLAGGAPSAKTVLDKSDGKAKHYPAIRGVVVEEALYASAEEAVEQARQIRDEYASLNFLPQIDTESLGLWNQEAHRQADDAELRTNSIIHIATTLLSPGNEGQGRDVLDDLEIDFELMQPEAMPEEVRACLPSSSECDDDEERADLFLENLANRGVMGFLVNFSTPVPRHTEDGGTWFSWGMTKPAWFYGETFHEAFEKAVEWAKEIHGHEDNRQGQ